MSAAIVLDKPCRSDLCYLYGFDRGCDWYRLTNYRAITRDPNDRRLTIKVLGRLEIDQRLLPTHILKRLCHFGFLDSDAIQFSDVLKLSSGFPSPTTQNMDALAALGKYLEADLPEGILLGGIGLSNGLFFQNEVVKHLYDRALRYK